MHQRPADAHDCIMVLVRLDRPHTSSWRDAAPVGGLPLRSLWLIPPGAPCRGPQTEPDGGKKPEKKRLTEKAPYKCSTVKAAARPAPSPRRKPASIPAQGHAGEPAQQQREGGRGAPIGEG